MGRESDGFLKIPIVFAHEKLGLSPNGISTIGFVAGIAAAGLVAAGLLLPGLIVMAVSQIIDGLDGGVARLYNLQSPTGRTLETVYDRLNELAILLALAYTGYVTYTMVGLAFIAILLVTMLEPLSGFDPGFKRFVIYFGYAATLLFHLRGFQIALEVIFFANLAGFAVGTILVDYRLQEEIDRQSMLRRVREVEAGIAQPPDDPPSFLSRLFS
ncbi:MAG TPA: CDP-alcohol phosphatidyltransferase family protein [Bacteroidota bacterium]|jgi:phosphatidylglycerophosphate synthase